MLQKNRLSDYTKLLRLEVYMVNIIKKHKVVVIVELILIWIIIHAPTSLVIDGKLGSITNSNVFVFLAVLQTTVITYFYEKILFLKKER